MFKQSQPSSPPAGLPKLYFNEAYAFKTTYTADSYSYNNIGLGLVANIKLLNFYIVANNLQWFSNFAKAKSVSLQMGLNIIIDENK